MVPAEHRSQPQTSPSCQPYSAPKDIPLPWRPARRCGPARPAPMASTPPSFTPALRMALNMVIPAHVMGAATSQLMDSGTCAQSLARPQKYSEKQPFVCRPARRPLGQKAEARWCNRSICLPSVVGWMAGMKCCTHHTLGPWSAPRPGPRPSIQLRLPRRPRRCRPAHATR